MRLYSEIDLIEQLDRLYLSPKQKDNIRQLIENITDRYSNQIEKMKCCGNCGNDKCTSKYRGNSIYHRQENGFACAENEDWKPRKWESAE